MISHKQMFALATELTQAKNQQDIETSLEIYHQQVELITPSLNAKGIGCEKARQQLELFFNVFPDYEVSLDQHAFNDNLMLAFGTVSVTPTIAPSITQQQFEKISVPVFIEFHFKDNKISKEVFNLDYEQVFKKSGLSKQELYMTNQLFINSKKAKA